jgi:hypothetical protein
LDRELGKLAAENVRSNLWAILSDEKPTEIDLDKAVANREDISFATENEIMPNEPRPIPITSGRDLASDWIQRVKSKQLILYVVGTITYDNGFGNDRTLRPRYYLDVGPPQMMMTCKKRK